MVMLRLLLRIVLSVATCSDVRTSAEVREARDGDDVSTFVTLCAWQHGRPESLSCRQVEL